MFTPATPPHDPGFVGWLATLPFSDVVLLPILEPRVGSPICGTSEVIAVGYSCIVSASFGASVSPFEKELRLHHPQWVVLDCVI